MLWWNSADPSSNALPTPSGAPPLPAENARPPLWARGSQPAVHHPPVVEPPQSPEVVQAATIAPVVVEESVIEQTPLDPPSLPDQSPIVDEQKPQETIPSRIRRPLKGLSAQARIQQQKILEKVLSPPPFSTLVTTSTLELPHGTTDSTFLAAAAKIDSPYLNFWTDNMIAPSLENIKQLEDLVQHAKTEESNLEQQLLSLQSKSRLNLYVR